MSASASSSTAAANFALAVLNVVADSAPSVPVLARTVGQALALQQRDGGGDCCVEHAQGRDGRVVGVGGAQRRQNGAQNDLPHHAARQHVVVEVEAEPRRCLGAADGRVRANVAARDGRP